MGFLNRLKNLVNPMSELVHTLTGHKCPISSIAISSNGQFLASASGDATIKIWDLRTGTLLRNISSPSIGCVAISPDCRTIIGGGIGNPIKIWNLTDGKLVQSLGEPSDWVNSIAFTPDGSTIVTASKGTINLWDLRTGELFRTINSEHAKDIIAVSPDGQFVAFGSQNCLGGGGPIKLWSIKTGELVSTIGETQSSFQLVILKNSNELKNLTNNSNEAKTINTSGSGYDPMDYYDFITFSPDGQTIATSGDNSTIRLWNLKAAKVYKLFGHSEVVKSGAFSPNGQILATGSHDKTIKLWSLRTQRELCTLSGHSDRIASVAFSPNGQILASGSEDFTVKVWSLANSLV